MPSPTCSRRTLLTHTLAGAVAAALPAPVHAVLASPLPDFSDPDFWWGAFRDLTLAGLACIPGIGGVVAMFASLLLPSSIASPPDEQWQRYIDAVNRIVDSKIDAALYLQVRSRLQGLTAVLRLYQSAQQAGDEAHLRRVEDAINVTMTALIPEFMLKGHEFRLLPLFVPAANLHLGLLRNAAQMAGERGDTAVHADYCDQLQRAIDDYGSYYDLVVAGQLHLHAQQHPHERFRARSQPLAAVLELRTQLQLRLGDMRDCWPWFNARRYPGTVHPCLNREVFSPLLGSWYDDRQRMPEQLPVQAPPAGPVEAIELGGFVFTDGMALRYADGQGPDAVSGIRIGGRGGHWQTIDDVVSRGHVVAVEVCSGYAVNAVELEFGDGSRSARAGEISHSGAGHTRIAVPGHRVSSVMGFGTAASYGGVLSGFVVGLQLLKMDAKAGVSPGVRQHLRSVWPSALQAVPRV